MDLYIIPNTSGLDTCIIGKKNIYTIHDKVYNSFEIDLLIGETRYSTEVYEHLSNYLKSLGYNYIVIAGISTNFAFIKDNDFIVANSLRFYTYNYNIPVLNQNDFSLSIAHQLQSGYTDTCNVFNHSLNSISTTDEIYKIEDGNLYIRYHIDDTYNAIRVKDVNIHCMNKLNLTEKLDELMEYANA